MTRTSPVGRFDAVTSGLGAGYRHWQVNGKALRGRDGNINLSTGVRALPPRRHAPGLSVTGNRLVEMLLSVTVPMVTATRPRQNAAYATSRPALAQSATRRAAPVPVAWLTHFGIGLVPVPAVTDDQAGQRAAPG